MTHLSDDDLAKEFEMLGQSFQPSANQKEKVRRQIFQPRGNNKAFRIQKWIPTILSLVVLLSIGMGTFFLLNNEHGSSGKSDVTAAWQNVLLTQTSRTSPTNYYIIFSENSLVIREDYNSFLGYNPNLSEEEFLKRYKIKETPLVAGEYTNYSIKKNNDTYTIKVDSEQGFTYTLKKVAPRKYVGEEGIEYSTGAYLE